ncbi:MAG TPA: alpha/beta hydrolase [Pyrinomonadaceae bacterium]|nr:alpha/beta hydrolase [Pyrinomonadaceae bacterium]
MEIELIRELISVQGWNHDLSLSDRREWYDRAEKAFAPEVSVDVEVVMAGGRPAEWLRPRTGCGTLIVLYLHGGAYAFGSPKSHRHIAAAIAEAASASALVFDYRLAPEHPFPAAVEDTMSAYLWLLNSGIDPSNVVVAGDSAGAGLTLALMISLRDKGLPLPAAGVCISPWTDLTCSGSSHTSKADSDPLLNTGDLHQMAALYLNGEDPRNPLASPAFANLEGLSPLLVQVGSEEILLEDARELARRATAVGVSVKLEEWRDMIHVWHWYFPLLQEGREAITATAEFIRSYAGMSSESQLAVP